MLEKLLRGVIGGLAGTLAHSAVMLSARRAGRVGELPPKAITDEMLETFGAHPGERTRAALAVVNHVGFGVGTGALFALAQPAMSRGRSMVAGAVYGAAVWLASYEGWVPHVLGALPRAHRDRWDRQAALLAAHIAFGVALGAVTARPEQAAQAQHERELREAHGFVDGSNINEHAERVTESIYANNPLSEPA